MRCVSSLSSPHPSPHHSPHLSLFHTHPHTYFLSPTCAHFHLFCVQGYGYVYCPLAPPPPKCGCVPFYAYCSGESEAGRAGGRRGEGGGGEQGEKKGWAFPSPLALAPTFSSLRILSSENPSSTFPPSPLQRMTFAPLRPAATPSHRRCPGEGGCGGCGG